MQDVYHGQKSRTVLDSQRHAPRASNLQIYEDEATIRFSNQKN